MSTSDYESVTNELKDLKAKLSATETYLQQSLELNSKLEVRLIGIN